MAKKRRQATGEGSANNSNGHETGDRVQYVSLSQETRRRYLNYALSVISSRALPDVRDGLKPVQRRILYVMYQELHLTPDAKRVKCMQICGTTTGKYHPHGEGAVYEALVRLAQDFTMRYPLIDNQGNFGSVLGLPHAAARYTEAKLSAIAAELMSEFRYHTVDMRPTYDATLEEPVVLPSRFPHLLVNGTQGIAVGMATSIPPHNLGEVIKACLHLIREPNATVAQLMKFVKGPDFPLGGRIVTDRTTLRQTYEEGRGSIKVRGEWKEVTEAKRSKNAENARTLVVYSVPHGVDTGPLIADIGGIITSRKLPQLVDVIDETNEKNGLRIVLQIQPSADANAVLAYLYKHTSLEQNFGYNATCLIPDQHGALLPARLSLVQLLQEFLNFRLITVRRRFEYQLRQLEKRIHVLKGFAIIFKGLDLALKIIRGSSGKADASEKLRAAFPLDELQAGAILEMQLYRISKLEIDQILEELKDKETKAARIRKILASEKRLWNYVAKELEELGDTFGDKRRTTIGSSEEIAEFDAQAYIVRENTNVVVTREGWIKRVGRLASVETTRVREGDSVLDVAPGNTLESVVLLASDGTAYTLPIDQVPSSSGYGDPLSKYVRLGDGVSIVSAVTTDARFTPADSKVKNEPTPAPYLLIVTARGQVLRYSFSGLRTPSTKAGRKYCRLRKDDRVVFAELVRGGRTMFIATKQARVIHFEISEVPVLANAGIGVRGIKLAGDDAVLGAVQLGRPSDTLRVRNTNDRELSFGQMKYGVTSRGGKGVKTSHRSGFEEILRPPIELVDWNSVEESE